jgi:ABC-type lipoprotein export system ATPase subunit
MIRIQNLHKYFNKGRQNEIHVIDGIDLELPERGMTAIFGKSGCGKTTLLNVIGGLDGFASGSVSIEGKDIRTDTDDLRNRYVGYIFQNYNLNKEESCFDNVAATLRLCGMSDEEEIARRVTAALRNVGMEKYEKRLPSTLSGGQQQRIAIARAIVKNPRIILADEPTGNLDEANTVMIMDLLKSISENHLVLLVTHEAHLVDHYCDTVIELSDGKVVNVRRNENADGYSVRDKNHVYLGEMECSELSDTKAHIEYYGDAPEEPLRLRVVNSGGKLYVEIQSEKAQLLDASSEVRLIEGVFEEKKKEKSGAEIDMSALPPVEVTETGKLFSFKSSLKSGYAVNFKKNKRGKKVLRACMCMFSAIIVLMTAIFGTAIGNILKARDSYNHNIFYLYTPDGKVSDRLLEALENGEGAIDFLRIHGNYPSSESWIDFRVNGFETFQTGYRGMISTKAAFLEHGMVGDAALLAGSKDDLQPEDILITRKVADEMIKQSAYGFISEYRDLIGMISTSLQTREGKQPRVVGILESEELAVYFDELTLAKYTMESAGFRYQNLNAYLASDYGLEVKKGEFIHALINAAPNTGSFAVGDQITVNGAEFSAAGTVRTFRIYEEWLTANGIKKLSLGEWAESIVKAENPDIVGKTEEFKKKCSEVENDRIAEYYDDYYEHLDQYLEQNYRYHPDEDLWLYFAKGCKDARYMYADRTYYRIQCYRELYGKTPTAKELSAASAVLPSEPDMIDYYNLYEDEYYSLRFNRLASSCYLISDEDYVMLSKRIGDTTDVFYTTIHSTDPAVTKEWLLAEFGDIPEPFESVGAIRTPEDMFKRILEAELVDIVGGLVTIAVLLAVMSVCMYFIMRSALMNRIKEVGIYRAIGVSKKNLIFKFFTEALVLTTLTVFFGYLATSAFILACGQLSPLVAEVFFYPVWMALIVLAVLYALSLVCGTLPILSLLRKTPSEILAKYDI